MAKIYGMNIPNEYVSLFFDALQYDHTGEVLRLIKKNSTVGRARRAVIAARSPFPYFAELWRPLDKDTKLEWYAYPYISNARRFAQYVQRNNNLAKELIEPTSAASAVVMPSMYVHKNYWDDPMKLQATWYTGQHKRKRLPGKRGRYGVEILDFGDSQSFTFHFDMGYKNYYGRFGSYFTVHAYRKFLDEDMHIVTQGTDNVLHGGSDVVGATWSPFYFMTPPYSYPFEIGVTLDFHNHQGDFVLPRIYAYVTLDDGAHYLTNTLTGGDIAHTYTGHLKNCAPDWSLDNIGGLDAFYSAMPDATPYGRY